MFSKVFKTNHLKKEKKMTISIKKLAIASMIVMAVSGGMVMQMKLKNTQENILR